MLISTLQGVVLLPGTIVTNLRNLKLPTQAYTILTAFFLKPAQKTSWGIELAFVTATAAAAAEAATAARDDASAIDKGAIQFLPTAGIHVQSTT